MDLDFLLPRNVQLPALVWEAKRHLWSEVLHHCSIFYICCRQLVLRFSGVYAAIHCRESHSRLWGSWSRDTGHCADFGRCSCEGEGAVAGIYQFDLCFRLVNRCSGRRLLCRQVQLEVDLLDTGSITVPAVLSVMFGLQSPKKEKTDWRLSLRRVDFSGALLSVATVVCLLLGLDRGSNVSWSSPAAIVPLALLPVFFGMFILVEARFAAEPIVPGYVVFNRTVISVYICNFFLYSAWTSLIFYIPLFYQAVDGVTSSQAGTRILPAIIPGVLGTLIGGFILRRIGKYYKFMVLSALATCLTVIPIILGTVYQNIDVLLISIGLAVNSTFYGFVIVGSLIALSIYQVPKS